MIDKNYLKVKSSDINKVKIYIPPVAGNGELCYLVDYTGAQQQIPYEGGYFKMIPTIWWAGKRYDNHQYTMIPFGHFENLITSKNTLSINSWEQKLDPENGIIESNIKLADSVREKNIVFSPLTKRLIVVRKKIENPDGISFQAGLSFILSPPDNIYNLPERMLISSTVDKNLINISYTIDGYKRYAGNILFFSDINSIVSINYNCFEQSIPIDKRAKITEATFYILFYDEDDKESLDDYINYIKSLNFRNLYREHISEWSEFHQKGFINIPDKKLETQWKTSLYHLRISSTKWSIPTGIFNTHWNGRYFYDEFYSFLAFLSSGHPDLSEKTVYFRRNTLKKALYRTWNTGALYPWESTEDGNDGAPHGASLNELHHCGMIALECWLQYLYTDDIDYLKNTAYPVIKNTAEFYRKWLIIELDNNTAIIQKCVDMDESVVPVLNPLYTACSAIFNLKIAAKAAKKLNTDKEYIKIWENLANKLKKNLPVKNSTFIPYKGSKDTQVQVLGILHPFSIFSTKNTKVRKTIYNFMKKTKNKYGYSAGTSKFYKNQSWTWAAGWLATCLNLLKDNENAYKTLLDSILPAGVFGCMNEHYKIDKKIYTVPWFTTSSGIFIFAVNSMLMHSDENRITLFPVSYTHLTLPTN